ncbi:YdaS family helix-turn-helix protein [Citrobacter sp. Cpo102]|uniref:transcriptional regulator n=1 Tax=Citrobacter sp. Cpo102 TaxID=2985142 RepID=UPI0025755EB9|nr:YdaS family helix-turn-helix protein [Citrobacter sp. Cpo102]MDM2819465.1 helix-turn-helix domain-containing protein [Citrobacter sp. Cpo102]
MQLSEYFTTRGNAKMLAKKLGISKSYLSQMASGKSAISPERAIEIECLTGGFVTRADCLPERWKNIWPEFSPQAVEPTTDKQTRL